MWMWSTCCNSVSQLFPSGLWFRSCRIRLCFRCKQHKQKFKLCYVHCNGSLKKSTTTPSPTHPRSSKSKCLIHLYAHTCQSELYIIKATLNSKICKLEYFYMSSFQKQKRDVCLQLYRVFSFKLHCQSTCTFPVSPCASKTSATSAEWGTVYVGTMPSVFNGQPQKIEVL